MKRLPALIVLASLLILPLGAGERSATLVRIYWRTENINQKLAVIQDLTGLDDKGLEAFFKNALDQLVYGSLASVRKNKATYDKWEFLARTIVMEIGDIKAVSAISTVWEVAQTAEVPLLKAESLISLGRLQAVKHAPAIALMLKDLNLNARPDKEAAEIEAYGAVLAMDAMKQDAGFEPLFYASIGWYKDRVTDTAEASVSAFYDDPVPQLIEIMENAGDYGDKRKVLEAVLRSSSPVGSKTAAAAAALREGFRYAESDPSRRNELTGLRLAAIRAYIDLDNPSDEFPDMLNRAVDFGKLDEKLIAIIALGSDGGEEAASYLADRLTKFNSRQSGGVVLNDEELIVVKQIIFSLGESRNAVGLPPLEEMEYGDFPPELKRHAADAMKKIRGN